MDRFNQSITRPDIPFREATKDTPGHALPALAATVGMSLGSGFVFTVSVGLICWALDKPFRIALLVGGIVMTLVGIYWFWQGQNLMWSTERILGVDIDHNGYVGQPPLPQLPHVVVKAQAEDGSNRWALSDLPGEPMTIAAWIKAAKGRQSLALTLWEPAFGYTTSRLGKQIPIYTLFRKELSDRGWVIDRGSHGVILSNEGRRILVPALEQVEALALPQLKDGK